MRAILNSNPRSFLRVAFIALAAAFFATAQAQPTTFETQLSWVLANDVDATIINCPAEYPITNLAACFRMTSGFDLSRSWLELSISGYGDATWVSPWTVSDDGTVNTRALEVEGHPLAGIFLTPDYNSRNSDYSTIVWVIELNRFP